MLTRSKQLQTTILHLNEGLASFDWTSVITNSSSSGRAKAIIVTDQTVRALHGESVTKSIIDQGIDAHLISIADKEIGKSLDSYVNLINQILLLDINKYTYIIGLGGGVVNNIAGFAASTIYRGLPLIQVPTTLLAQADAAIDFKQAINAGKGKNQIGAYYAATAVIIATKVLSTLPAREISNGLQK